MISLPAIIIYAVLGSLFIALFSGPFITIIFIIICLYILWNNRLEPGIYKNLNNSVISTWLIFCVWVTISYLWSISPGETLQSSLKLWTINILALTAASSLLSGNGQKSGDLNVMCIFSALMVINALLIFEHLSGYQIALFLRDIFQYSTTRFGQPMDKATALYTLILPIFLLLLRERKSLFISLLLLSAVMYLIHPMLAATIAFIAAAVTVILYRLFGRIIISILFAGSILLFLFIPQIMSIFLQLDLLQANLQSLPPSWVERVDIWQHSVELISQKPVLGWGLNSSDFIENIADNTKTNLILLHPHNIPLQLQLESGFIGGFLFSTVLFAVYMKLTKIKKRNLVCALLASYSAFLVFSLVSFNAWHTWWLCTIFITVLTIIASGQMHYKKT